MHTRHFYVLGSQFLLCIDKLQNKKRLMLYGYLSIEQKSHRVFALTIIIDRAQHI